MANILNLKTDPALLATLNRDPEYNGIIRIDRQTKWGNPFVIGKHGDRAEVIARYRRNLWQSIVQGKITLQELAAIADKPLACWCHPLPCHGDVLASAALWAAGQLKTVNEPRA